MIRLGLLLSLLVLGSCVSQVEKDSEAIASLLDTWHKSAATGDLETYFDLFHPEGHFLGTDQSEDWSKQEFYEFCKPYFEDGQAWDFKPKDRNIYFNSDGQTVWFNEVLNTWMGPCRGSGILVLEKGEWKLMQYNLAVLVSNDLIKDYLKLLEDPEDE